MKKPNKPVKPSKPKKPEPPLKMLDKIEYLPSPRNYQSIKDYYDNLPEKTFLSYENIYFDYEESYCYECRVDKLQIYYNQKIDNPYYEQQLKEYNKKLKEYEEVKLPLYEKKIEKYKKDMELFSGKIDDYLKWYKDAKIEELEKELRELKG